MSTTRGQGSQPTGQIALGVVLLLVGASILYGNISHNSYGLMTGVAVVFMFGGLYGVVRGVSSKKKG